MRFLLDENAEYRLALFLRAHDHNATSIARDYAQGMSDRDILDVAYREQRILITRRDQPMAKLHARKRQRIDC